MPVNVSDLNFGFIFICDLKAVVFLVSHLMKGSKGLVI